MKKAVLQLALLLANCQACLAQPSWTMEWVGDPLTDADAECMATIQAGSDNGPHVHVNLLPGYKANVVPLLVLQAHRNAFENAKPYGMEMESLPGGRKLSRSFREDGSSIRRFPDAFAEEIGGVFRTDDGELIGIVDDLLREILGDMRRGETLDISLTFVGEDPIRASVPVDESFDKAREECREELSSDNLFVRWLYRTFPSLADTGR